MKTIAVILASLTLGLTAPAAAHAQFIDNAVRRAAAKANPDAPAAAPPNRPVPRERDNNPSPRFADLQQGRENNRNQIQNQPPGQQPPAERPQPPAARLISLDQAINAVKRTTPGRFLDADPPDAGSSRPTYGIRWQADSGQRIDFTVDARTGAIIGRRGG